MDFWLLVVLAVATFGAVAVVRWRLHQKKVSELEAFAAERGWYYAERDEVVLERYAGGDPFGRGHSRKTRHVMEGQHRDRHLVAFEYRYTEGSGDDARTVKHMVLSLTTPGSRPTLEVSREGLGRKLLGLVGVHDLQLESEQFNETFLIRTEDDKFAYDVLHPRMMEWMLADQRALELPFRFERNDLLSWTKGEMDLGRVLWMLDYLCDVLDRVPAFVWKP